MVKYGHTEEQSSDTCHLASDESIRQVKLYRGKSSINVVGLPGIQFITNMKSCPLFGTATFDSEHVSGHQLLGLEATQGIYYLRGLTLFFDYNCANL